MSEHGEIYWNPCVSGFSAAAAADRRQDVFRTSGRRTRLEAADWCWSSGLHSEGSHIHRYPQSLWKHEYSAQLGLWSLTLSLSWSNLSYLVWQFFRDLLSKRVCGTGSKLDSVLHWYKTRDCLQLLCKFPALIKEKWSWAAVVTQPDTDGGWCKFCV